MKITQIVFPSKEITILKQFDMPSEPEKDQVLVKADYSAISAGTELANWHALPNTEGGRGEWPFRPGYSAVGHVVKTGPDVKELKPGDSVIVIWSGHRSYYMMPEKSLIKYDSSLDGREVAFANIMTFSLLGLRKLRLELGESAMIAGQGLLGVFAAQYARLSGACPVIVSDCSPERRELALKLGADFAFDPRDKDFIEKVKAASGGDGPNGVVEVTGFIEALKQALKYIARDGRISLLGCTRISDQTIDYYQDVHCRGITIVGAHTSTRPGENSQPGRWTQRDDIKTFLKFLKAKKISVLPVIGNVVSPLDAEKVYREIGFSKNPPLGTVFDWHNID